LIAEALEDRRLLAAARLGDFVWNDLNGNGIQDAGEPGVAGVVVEAFSSENGFQGDDDDVSRAIAVTDATGHYTLDFDVVYSGNQHFLQFRVPRDYTFTTRNAGGDDTRDSDVYAGGTTSMFFLGVGHDNPTFDAGVRGSPPAFGFALSAEAQAFGTATDAGGNVYVTGNFSFGRDFDPGPGETLVSAKDSLDVFVAKYTAAGALLWVRSAESWNIAAGKSVAVGQDGSVYVLGYFSEKADFAPGPATYELTSVGGLDVFVWKLDAAGNSIWARSWGGTNNDVPYGLALSPDGSVCTTGQFSGMAYFGGSTLTSAGGADVFVSKLDAAGNFMWIKSFGAAQDDVGYGISVAQDGTVYTTGSFQSSPDFDPGTGVHQLTSAGSTDVFLWTLHANGGFVAASRYGGTGADVGLAVAVADDQSIYTTGYFSDSGDFNPGAGTLTLTSAGGTDAFLVKLDASRSFVWADAVGGPSDDVANAVAWGPNSSVYLSGAFQGTADFDPGVGTFHLTSAGMNDVFVSQFDAAGVLLSAKRVGGSSDDIGYGLAVMPDGRQYLTGAFGNTADFDPGPGSYLLTTSVANSMFLVQFGTAALSGRVWHDANGNGLQDAGEAGIAGAVVQAYRSPDNTVGNSDDVSVGPAVITDAAGNYALDGLADGVKHYLVFRAPVGYSFTVANVGTDDTLDSDADASGRSGLFTLAAGQTDSRFDVGLLGSEPAFGMALRAGGLASNAPSSANGNALATDAAGNIIVVGTFTATADFDPGPLAYTLTSAGTPGSDVYVAKYSAGGALAWARRLGNTNTEAVNDVAVGANGNIVVTGSFSGTVDFDPGPGAYNLTGTGGDAFVWLLDTDGNFIWARNLGGSSADVGNGVAFGPDGSVYVTGTFQGTADFDPGTGTLNLTSAGSTDAFLVRLGPAGDLVWAGRMGGTQADEGKAVAPAADGTVYLAGDFRGTADFDPGAGVANLTSAGSTDVFVVKLDAAGNLL